MGKEGLYTEEGPKGEEKEKGNEKLTGVKKWGDLGRKGDKYVYKCDARYITEREGRWKDGEEEWEERMIEEYSEGENDI